jgi:PAS domain-containing protein
MLLIQVAVGAASVAVGTALVVHLSRTKSSAATALRSVVAALVATTVVGTVAAVSADGPAWLSTVVPSGPVETLAVGLAAAVGVPWLVFALRYTGRDNLLTTPVRFGLALVAVGTVAAQFVVAPIEDTGLQSAGSAVAALTLLSVRGLLFVTAATVVRESIGDTAVPRQQGVGFGTAALLPFLATVLPDPGVFGLSIGVVALTVRLSDPFGRLPAAEVVGRDRVFSEMSAAVAVVDGSGTVRDLNETAETTFETDRSEAVGEPLETVAPSLAAAGPGPFRTQTETDRYLRVSVTTVTDDSDRTVGRLFVCRDVTERRSRERRLQLVTQLLADAVYDRMSAVATAVADEETRPPVERRPAAAETPQPSVDREETTEATTGPGRPDGTDPKPRTTATALATVVSTVRELGRAIEEGDTGSYVQFDGLLRDAASTPDGEVSVTTTTGVSVAEADAPLVQTAVETLCEAGTDTVVAVTETNDEVTITVDGAPPDDAAAEMAAVTLARIVADTLGGRVETSRADSSRRLHDTDETCDAADGPGADWRVVVSVPVRDGTIAPSSPREGRTW